jgi:hypothetical protein
LTNHDGRIRLFFGGQTMAPGILLPPELRHRCTPPRLLLHSGSQVSSLRRIEWCDQSSIEFSAKRRAPNPTPLSSQIGWRTTDRLIDAVTSPA